MSLAPSWLEDDLRLVEVMTKETAAVVGAALAWAECFDSDEDSIAFDGRFSDAMDSLVEAARAHRSAAGRKPGEGDER